MAPSRRAFLAAAAATMAAACSDLRTRSGIPTSTARAHPRPSAIPTTATPGAGAAPTTAADGRPARVVFAGPRTGRQFSLTFHLSGDPGLVARLLEVAAQAGVPISLFAVGRWLTEHPALVRRILADGHELDNHTWSHPVLGRLDRPAVAAEIRRCRAALTQASGSGGRYFRPSGMTRPTPWSWPRPRRPATRWWSPSTSTPATTPTRERTRSPPGSPPDCGPARSSASTPATPAPWPPSPPS